MQNEEVGMMLSALETVKLGGSVHSEAEIAQGAYQIADAMLIARQPKE